MTPKAKPALPPFELVTAVHRFMTDWIAEHVPGALEPAHLAVMVCVQWDRRRGKLS